MTLRAHIIGAGAAIAVSLASPVHALPGPPHDVWRLLTHEEGVG